VRHDIGARRIPADAALRIDQPRRTTLELNGIRVEMVEHVLAALAGMRVDNCEVWVDSAEMPGCDGSSKAFVEAIDAAGVVEQRSPVRQIVVGQSVRVGGEESWMKPNRRGVPALDFLRIDYGEQTAIGRQLRARSNARFVSPRVVCHTFIPQEAADSILAVGTANASMRTCWSLVPRSIETRCDFLMSVSGTNYWM
jgi:UDP-3-O-acyl-N-acetylglucosamine deacetylase